MKRKRSILLICCITLCMAPLNAQTVIRIVSGYVLIDTDTGIGKVDEIIAVYRLIDEKIMTIGQVRIVTFRQGLTAVKIINLEPGLDVAPGDYVKLKGFDDSIDKSISATQDRNRDIPIIGVHFGRFLPSSNLDNTFENSFSLGISLKLMHADRHAFFADITYPILRTDLSETNHTKSTLYSLNIVDHIRMGQMIHFDIGGGLYFSKGSITANGQSVEESKSCIGFFLGLSLDFISTSGWLFSPMVRVHMYKPYDEWNEFIVCGMNVRFSIF